MIPSLSLEYKEVTKVGGWWRSHPGKNQTKQYRQVVQGEAHSLDGEGGRVEGGKGVEGVEGEVVRGGIWASLEDSGTSVSWLPLLGCHESSIERYHLKTLYTRSKTLYI